MSKVKKIIHILYDLENHEQNMSDQNKTNEILEKHLDRSDVKNTENLNRVQTLKLSTTNLD